MAVIQQAAGVVMILVVPPLWPQLARSSWFLMCANFLPLYLLGLPAALAMTRRLPDLPAPAARRLRPVQFAQLAFASMAAAYALNVFSQLLNRLIGSLKGSDVLNPLEQLMPEGSSPWVVLLFVVLLTPLFEEFVFRWLLYKKLAAFGAKTYILFSALVFALYHVNFYQMFYAFALGLALAGLTYYTGNLRASVALHLTVNLVGSGLPLLLDVDDFVGGDQLRLLAVGAAPVLIGAAGAVSAVLLFRRRKELELPPGGCAPPSGKAVFGNPGMVALLLFLMGLTVFTVLAPTGA
jgi:membrane protease YdiL (CAAX protease family)